MLYKCLIHSFKVAVKRHNLCTWFECQLRISSKSLWMCYNKFQQYFCDCKTSVYWLNVKMKENVCAVFIQELSRVLSLTEWIYKMTYLKYKITPSLMVSSNNLKKHWLWYVIWRGRGWGWGRSLSLVSCIHRWIWGMQKINLETLLVWKMIKRSLWRTHSFKELTWTVGFQSISQ